MRSKYEIEKLARHFEDALHQGAIKGDPNVSSLLPLLGVLRWVLGEETSVSKLVASLDAVDRARDQAAGARAVNKLKAN